MIQKGMMILCVTLDVITMTIFLLFLQFDLYQD